jgi:phosphohistidine phosphatase
MKLYLVQHGEAKSEKEDPDRSLTDRGKAEIRAVAEAAKRAGLKPAQMFHSGKRRAQQTADILASALRCPLKATDGLEPNDDIQPWIDRIAAEKEDLILVGHLPFLQKLAIRLISGGEEIPLVAFRNGAIICLGPTPGRLWVIHWILHPDLIPGLTFSM